MSSFLRFEIGSQLRKELKSYFSIEIIITGQYSTKFYSTFIDILVRKISLFQMNYCKILAAKIKTSRGWNARSYSLNQFTSFNWTLLKIYKRSISWTNFRVLEGYMWKIPYMFIRKIVPYDTFMRILNFWSHEHSLCELYIFFTYEKGT